MPDPATNRERSTRADRRWFGGCPGIG